MEEPRTIRQTCVPSVRDRKVGVPATHIEHRATGGGSDRRGGVDGVGALTNSGSSARRRSAVGDQLTVKPSRAPRRPGAATSSAGRGCDRRARGPRRADRRGPRHHPRSRLGGRQFSRSWRMKRSRAHHSSLPGSAIHVLAVLGSTAGSISVTAGERGYQFHGITGDHGPTRQCTHSSSAAPLTLDQGLGLNRFDRGRRVAQRGSALPPQCASRSSSATR